MQDRYAGDIGDYGKIALLKAVQAQGLSVAVNWYLVEPLDFEKKDDGTFKREDGRHLVPEELRACDEALANKLTEIARCEERSVRVLEQAELISEAVYFHEPVKLADRQGWHLRALEEVKAADMVFLDPDNGMLVKSVGKGSTRSVKYAFYEEVRDYVQRGQSVLIYNHRCRKMEAKYFHEICDRLWECTGALESEILKITFPKRSVRDYLAVPASREHREKIESAFSSMEQGIWGRLGACRIPR